MLKIRIEDKNGLFAPVCFCQKQKETETEFMKRWQEKYKELFMKYNKNGNKLYISTAYYC